MAARGGAPGGPAGGGGAKEVFLGVTDGLKKLYQRKIRPVEQNYLFDQFASPLLTDADIEAKPMVLLLGQYSVGKTTFIKYLLGRDFPGAHIGPEPTTDKFMAIQYGTEERVVPGNALAVQADQPFRALQRFGTGFLNKFNGSQLQCELLEHIMFIDTPGVLAGEKQRLGRAYEFTEVVEWFAERADMILLLFDAHKLDISDEFRSTIQVLKAHDDKVRVVLNKADMVSTQQLMRVYGALMWSLGKCIQTPEVPRVYIGSFWDQPLRNEELRPLFDAEMSDLINDLKALPRNNAMRKVNELVKRSRLAKTHALIIGHLKDQMPSFFGREKAQKKMIKNLAEEFNKVRIQYRLPISDFPPLERFRQTLSLLDFDKFPKTDLRMIAEMDNVLAVDIPDLLKRFPVEPTAAAMAMASALGNPFAEASPFTASQVGLTWTITDADREKYARQFVELQPVGGRLSGATLKPFLMQSKLSQGDLLRIWALADMDRDAHLNFDEFTVAMYLIHARMCGAEIPPRLPDTLLQSLARPQGTPPPPLPASASPPAPPPGALPYPTGMAPAPMGPAVTPVAALPPPPAKVPSFSAAPAPQPPPQPPAAAPMAQTTAYPGGYALYPPQPQPQAQPQAQPQPQPQAQPQARPPAPPPSQPAYATPPAPVVAQPPAYPSQPAPSAAPSGGRPPGPAPPAPDLLDLEFNPFAEGHGDENPFTDQRPLLPGATYPPGPPHPAVAAAQAAAQAAGALISQQIGAARGMQRLE